MRPELECCTPYLAPFPSGYHWSHSLHCSIIEQRGQKVRQHDSTAKIDAALHPAGANIGRSPVAIWRSHPHGCRCTPCSYVNYHLDDDDDERILVTDA